MRDRSNNPSHHRATSHSFLHKNNKTARWWINPELNGSTMRDRSNNPSHHRATYHTYLHKNNKTAPRGIDPTTHQFLSMLLTERERERNVLFNNALNTFYLWLYGVRHMVKDHSDSEKGNPLPPHRLLLSINSKGSFIWTIPQTG